VTFVPEWGPKLQSAPHSHVTQAQLTLGTPAQTMTGAIAQTTATLNERRTKRNLDLPSMHLAAQEWSERTTYFTKLPNNGKQLSPRARLFELLTINGTEIDALADVRT
jgi:hypothetical protein